MKRNQNCPTAEIAPTTILEAKDALRSAIEENPFWPDVDVVRLVAQIYLDDPNTERFEFSEVGRSYTTGAGGQIYPYGKFMKRIVVENLAIESGREDERILLERRAVTLHGKKWFLPAILGSVAFKKTTMHEPRELLYVDVPGGEEYPPLEISSGSEMHTRDVAQQLLDLPDDPVSFRKVI